MTWWQALVAVVLLIAGLWGAARLKDRWEGRR